LSDEKKQGDQPTSANSQNLAEDSLVLSNDAPGDAAAGEDLSLIHT